MNYADGISIVVPTFNGGQLFSRSLQAIRDQEFDGDVQLIVIDSGSSDATPEVAEKFGAQVLRIEQKDFHHSRTRNQAVACAKYDKVVLFVQDAIPASKHWLRDLSDSLDNADVVAAYGKQLPHDDADLYARFEVEYHGEYLGDEQVIQTLPSQQAFYDMSFDDALRAVRFDNVCAIYRRDMLMQVPFPDIPFGEDMAWAKTMLMKGHLVTYNPQIQVKHSHNRPPDYRFRRAIVDTVACAEILERIREDLSYLKPSDLYSVMSLLEEKSRIVMTELQQQHGPLKTNPTLDSLRTVSKKFPAVKRVLWKLLSLAGKSKLQNGWVVAFSQAAEHHMRHVLNELNRRYPHATVDELSLALEQVSASLQGRVFGDVMASYASKGNVPSEIREIIAPHMKGV